MSDICAKSRIFAPSFFGMAYILMEARKAYFRVDESRQLTKESGIRKTLSPSVGCIPIYIPHLGREPFSYLIPGCREPING